MRTTIILWLSSLCLSILLLPAASAGVDNPSPAQADKNSREDGTPLAGRERVYQIRCWQEGKLLFEESDWVISPDHARQVIVSAKKRRTKSGLLVIELHNALCLLKEVN